MQNAQNATTGNAGLENEKTDSLELNWTNYCQFFVSCEVLKMLRTSRLTAN